MENQSNKSLTAIAVVVVAVLAGVSILVTMNSIVKNALNPIENKLIEIAFKQDAIEQKLGQGGGGSADLSVLQQKLDQLNTKLAGLNAPAPTPQRPQEDFDTKFEIPVDKAYVYGPKDAKVTITEFVDFECPFCSRFHPAVEQAANLFPEDVNYMIKNFPLSFHPNARPAAKVAMAAGEQGKYFEMADLLLKNQKNLNEAAYLEYAQQIGLNVEQFKKDLAEKDVEYEAIINADMELGAKVGVRGTPTFYINGRKTRARDVNSYKAEIEQILKGE